MRWVGQRLQLHLSLRTTHIKLIFQELFGEQQGITIGANPVHGLHHMSAIVGRSGIIVHILLKEVICLAEIKVVSDVDCDIDVID